MEAEVGSNRHGAGYSGMGVDNKGKDAGSVVGSQSVKYLLLDEKLSARHGILFLKRRRQVVGLVACSRILRLGALKGEDADKGQDIRLWESKAVGSGIAGSRRPEMTTMDPEEEMLSA